MNTQLSRQLQDLLNQGVTEEDPRVAALENMLARQGYPPQHMNAAYQPEAQDNPTDRTDGPVKPGMKTEEDYEKQFGKRERPDYTNEERREVPRPPMPGEMEEHDDARKMTDEELLSKAIKPEPDMEDEEYHGQPDSPDLPDTRDNEILRNSGDAGFIDYGKAFGLERLANPEGAPPGYIPMPRPRYPEMGGDEHPLGPEQQDMSAIIKQGADFGQQGVDRLRREYKEGNETPGLGMSDEEILELIQNGLAPPNSMGPQKKPPRKRSRGSSPADDYGPR